MTRTIVKTLKDDLAWKIQRELVRSYFRTHPGIGAEDIPNPDYISWMKKQRLAMKELRKFRVFVKELADQIIRTKEDTSWMDQAPMLKKAVLAVIKADPYFNG